MTDQDEARRALEMIEETRRDTARNAASPRGYYALVGAGVAAMIVGIADDGVLRWVLYAVGLAAILGGILWYRNRTGTMTFATFRERGAWLAGLLFALSVAGAVVALLGPIAAVIAAVLVWIGWVVIGPRWDAAWVRSIEEQP